MVAAKRTKPSRPFKESSSVDLPSGTKPFRRRPVRGLWCDVHVENLPTNGEVFEHRHSQWQIFTYFARATYKVVWYEPSGKKMSHEIVEGQVVILPAGWVHAARWRESGDGIWLYVDDAQVRHQFPNLPLDASILAFSKYVMAQPMIADLCRELRPFAAVPNGNSAWHVAATGSHLAEVLLETYQLLLGRVLPPLNGLAATIVVRMTAHVNEGHCGRAPVGRIARSLGISRRHLSRVFLQATGKSPRAWVLRKKAEHAKALLGAGRSVDETVEAGGFADASHLNRLLKKVFGVTANKLRAASARFHK